MTPAAPPSPAAPRDRAAALGVFLLLLGAYGLTNPGHVNAVDTWSALAEAAAIVECGSLRLEDLDPAVAGPDARTIAGKYRVNKYGPGLHAGYVPAYLVARLVADAAGIPPLSAAKATFSFVNTVAGALTGLFLLLALRQAGFRPGTALASTLAVGFGSFLWPLTGVSYSDPLQTAFVTAVLWRTFAAHRSPSRVNLHLLFLSAALAVSTKLANAPLVAALASVPLANPTARGRAAVAAATWGAALLGALALVNHARFGSPLETGYGMAGLFEVPPLAGLKLILVSFDRGFFWFFPLLPAAFGGLLAFARRDRVPGVALLAAVTAHFLLCLAYYDRHGGNCLGPRYLAVLLPPLGLGIAAGLETFRPPRALAGALLLLCVAWMAPLALVQWFLPQVVRGSVEAAGGEPKREPFSLTAARLLGEKSLRGPDSIPLARFSRTPVDGRLVLDAPDNRGWQPWWLKSHASAPSVLRLLGIALLVVLGGAGFALLHRSRPRN